jgi:hypothetical protein
VKDPVFPQEGRRGFFIYFILSLPDRLSIKDPWGLCHRFEREYFKVLKEMFVGIGSVLLEPMSMKGKKIM